MRSKEIILKYTKHTLIGFEAGDGWLHIFEEHKRG